MTDTKERDNAQERREEVQNEEWLELRRAKARARAAEHAAGVWKAVALGAACAAVLVEIVAVSAVRAQADPVPLPEAPAVQTVQPLPAEPAPAPLEDAENQRIEAALLERAVRLEDVTVTYYDPCVQCCGKADGITYTGVRAAPYVTCAVDPEVIPLGSDVLVDYGDGELHYLRAEDIGGAVQGNHIDVCVSSHEEALALGRRSATVYVAELE